MISFASLQKDRAYFLPKDSHWSFLWWELSQRTIRKYAAAGDFQLMFRVHDVTDILFDGENSHSHFDVVVTDKTDHWYLYIHASNRNYVAQVGFYRRMTGFQPVVRSNTLYLPPDRPSGDYSEIWTTIQL